MYIQLSRGYETIVNDDMFEELNSYKWHAVVTVNHTYARRCTDYIYTYMHHQIMRIHPRELKAGDLLIDHKDRDSLNNTRDNLRIITREGNVRNSVAFKNRGWIYPHKQSGKFCIIYKGLHLGQYRTHEEAEIAVRKLDL